MLAHKEAKTVGSLIGFFVFVIPLGLFALYLWDNTPLVPPNAAQNTKLSHTKNISPLTLTLRSIDKNRAMLTFKNFSSNSITIYLPTNPAPPIILSLSGKSTSPTSTHKLPSGATVGLRSGDSYSYTFDISNLPRGKILGAKYEIKDTHAQINLWRGSIKSNKITIP